MGNINSTQPVADTSSFITHPFLAARLRDIDPTTIQNSLLDGPSTRVRYIYTQIEEGHFGGFGVEGTLEECGKLMQREEAPLVLVDATFRYFLHRIRLEQCTCNKLQSIRHLVGLQGKRYCKHIRWI
jgi:hypothetical protein